MTQICTKETLWTRSFILVMLGMLFLFIPFSLYMPVLPVYLLQELHSSMEAAGAVNTIFLAASVLFRAQTVRLEARFGTRRVLLVSAFLSHGDQCCLSGCHNGDQRHADQISERSLFCHRLGVGYGTVVPSMQTLAIQLSPAHRSSAVTATFFSCLDGGIGLGAYFMGGGIQAFGYATVYLSLGLLSSSCILPYYLVHARKRR